MAAIGQVSTRWRTRVALERDMDFLRARADEAAHEGDEDFYPRQERQEFVYTLLRDFGKLQGDMGRIAMDAAANSATAAWGRFIGNMGAGRAAMFELPEDAVELVVATAPEFRGRGAATAAFASLLRSYTDAGIEKVYLNVRDGNNVAKHIYVAQGFVHHARTFNKTTGEGGQLMMADLTSLPVD